MAIALSVQSYCFRHFLENTVVAGKVRELGLRGIEVCGIHADFSDQTSVKGMVADYAAGGNDSMAGSWSCPEKPPELW